MTDDPMRGWQAFSDAARSYFEAATKPAAATGAAQQFSDFLREQFAAVSAPWGFSGAAPAAPAGGFDVPAFGATREHQQRAQRILQAMQRIDTAQRRLQRLWSDVLREAASKFVGQLPSQTWPGTADSLRALYDTWIDCAEDAYSRTAHGDAFCQAQAELANAHSQWRSEQQASIEHWLKMLDLPTRSEINSLTRRLHAAEATLRSTRLQSPPVSPTRAPQPARRKSSETEKKKKTKAKTKNKSRKRKT